MFILFSVRISAALAVSCCNIIRLTIIVSDTLHPIEIRAVFRVYERRENVMSSDNQR